MGNVLIINGSPRAVKSNSKQYAQLLVGYLSQPSKTMAITHRNHQKICDEMQECDDVVFVFPLYADSIPATLLQFLKYYEKYETKHTPRVHVIVNCGFIESMQNNVCLEMMKIFCQKNKLPIGSTLSIGSGEAILGTPFKVFVKLALYRFARALMKQRPKQYAVSMPLTKKIFIRASTNYWIKYGKQYGVSKAEMETMLIEQ